MKNDHKNAKGVTRAAIIELVKQKPITTTAMAKLLNRGPQAIWLAVRDLRRDGEPVRIHSWILQVSGKSLVPAYVYGEGEDAIREDYEMRMAGPKVPMRRDLAAVAMFGERGMAGNSTRQQA